MIGMKGLMMPAEGYHPILEGIQFIYFCLIVAITSLIGWAVFFKVVSKKDGNVRELLSGGSFLENLTVVRVSLKIHT
jgi:hypothetical protein